MTKARDVMIEDVAEVANELEAELSFCKGQAPEKTVFEQFGDTTSATAETTVTPVPA